MANLAGRSLLLTRNVLAFVALAAAGAFVGSPLGCLPPLPIPTEIPQAPQFEVPQAPDLQIPEFQPPELTPPDGPELPAEPPVSVGNCCLRTGKPLKEKCKGAMSCCTDTYEDSGECQDVKGYWFFTPEGCAGGC